MGALLAAVLDGALAASDTAWDSAALDGTEDAAASEAEEASGAVLSAEALSSEAAAPDSGISSGMASLEALFSASISSSSSFNLLTATASSPMASGKPDAASRSCSAEAA